MATKDRIKSNMLIKDAPLCNNCPARIYQKAEAFMLYGKGNLLADVVFVLPIEAYKVKQIDRYMEIVCEGIIDFDTEYITYHPKCSASSPVEGYSGYCLHYLLYELNRIKPKKIIFCGVPIPEQLEGNDRVFKINSPLSIYFGSDKLDTIREQLKKIL